MSHNYKKNELAIGFTIKGGSTEKKLTVSGDVELNQNLRDTDGPTFDHLHLTNGQIVFPATQVPSSDPNTLDDYVEHIADSAACTDAITTAVVWKLTKVGNLVTLLLPATTGTAVANKTGFSYGTVIPAAYRPASNMNFLVGILDNGAMLPAPGALYITASTGLMTIYKTAIFSGYFTAGAECGLPYAIGVSWIV